MNGVVVFVLVVVEFRPSNDHNDSDDSVVVVMDDATTMQQVRQEGMSQEMWSYM